MCESKLFKQLRLGVKMLTSLFFFFFISPTLSCKIIEGKIISYQGLYLKYLTPESYITKILITDVCNYSPKKVSLILTELNANPNKS